MTENDLQIQVAEYLDLKGLLWCHTPNEGKMAPQYGKKRKRMGVKAGVPDIMIFQSPPAGIHVGVALELKVGKNRPTAAQDEWLDNLTSNGWFCAVCTGFDETMKTLNWLGW